MPGYYGMDMYEFNPLRFLKFEVDRGVKLRGYRVKSIPYTITVSIAVVMIRVN